MSLSPGSRLGVYEVTAQIGEGGMGQVYRARDTKLNRDVALKVLPDSFANDADRFARFTREAQSLASLNHPNIAHIHGLEESGTVRALVMELVEGDDLSQMIARGAIPLDEALAVARQIAEALEAAHEQGIIHRDLKPANIKVRNDGAVKVLDFGLAKAMEPASALRASAGQALSMSPTITTPAMTQAGLILGTAAYMSPEQARGKTVDRRADIWAFGCVLYEMLTGKRLFEGEDLTETLANVVKDQPQLDAVPASVRRLLDACLQKDPKKRLQSIADMRLLLDAPVAARAAQTRSAWLWPAVAAVAVLGLATLATVHFREAPAEEAVLRLSVPLPEGASALGHVMVSPDGRGVAAAFTREGWNGLWVRALDGTGWTRIDAARGARTPFWSWDSRFVGFFADGKLKTVSAAGGPAKELCGETGLGLGGTWNRDGVILFGSTTGPLRQVNAAGGMCSGVTKDVPNIPVRFPEFLPDGRHFLYVGETLGEIATRGVYVSSLDDPVGDGLSGKKVLDDFSSVVYAPPAVSGESGHLLFLRGTTLMAQRFDTSRLEALGDPFPISDQASFSFSRPQAGASAAANGTIVYLANRPSNYQLTWIDRTGRQRTSVGSPADQRGVALSPDGSLATVYRIEEGLRLYDLARGSEVRFSTESAASAVVWSPDGRELVFDTTINGARGIYRKAANGSGKEALLLATPDNVRRPSDWSRDGRFLIYTELDPKTRADIWYLPDPGNPDNKPVKFLGTEAIESQGQLSPDGGWLAYSSNETGAGEVYIRQFPSGEGFARVSVDGGREPRWRHDGTELYYQRLSERGIELVAVPLRSDGRGGLGVGTPVTLFDFQSVPSVQENNSWLYSPHPDGQRFLVAVQAETAVPTINVIVNWHNAVAAGPER